MRIQAYVDFTEKTTAVLDTPQLDNLHMLMGMMTELGELMDVFKKNLAYKKDIDWVNVQEEIGDIMFYIAGFCRMNNLDLSKIIHTNMEKLMARYPERFSEENALNRDLEKERRILEK